MKVLCDVHIAKKVVRFFQSRDIEAIHVNDILDSWYSKDHSPGVSYWGATPTRSEFIIHPHRHDLRFVEILINHLKTVIAHFLLQSVAIQQVGSGNGQFTLVFENGFLDAHIQG